MASKVKLKKCLYIFSNFIHKMKHNFQNVSYNTHNISIAHLNIFALRNFETASFQYSQIIRIIEVRKCSA